MQCRFAMRKAEWQTYQPGMKEFRLEAYIYRFASLNPASKQGRFQLQQFGVASGVATGHICISGGEGGKNSG